MRFDSKNVAVKIVYIGYNKENRILWDPIKTRNIDYKESFLHLKKQIQE